MNTITTISILDLIIPVSRFNKSKASKIFNEVKLIKFIAWLQKNE